jgi:hypothetical protein
MRYFRRSGPSTIVRDGDGTARFITGPDAETGELGGILAYDDSDEAQARFAEQYTYTPGWYEVGQDGEPVPPQDARARASAEEEPAPAGTGEEIKDIDEPAPAG